MSTPTVTDEDLRQFSSVFSPNFTNLTLLSGSSTSIGTSYSSSGDAHDVSLPSHTDYMLERDFDATLATTSSLRSVDSGTISAQLEALTAGMRTLVNTVTAPTPQLLTKDMFIRKYKVCGQMLPFIIDTAIAMVFQSFPLHWPYGPSGGLSPLFAHIHEAVDLITKAHLEDILAPPEGKWTGE
jgi:hypothetical protein